MVLMAIDHVRVFSGLPAGGPTPGIFFTRWVTNFCAPAFVFLAGTSAFFYGRKHGDLPRFLLTRGLWLVFLELTILRFAWTFNLDVTHAMAGVIWMIGWCMVLMAALVRLPIAFVGALGLLIVGAHNLADPLLQQDSSVLTSGSFSALWKVLYAGFFAGPIGFGGGDQGPTLIVLYSIIPWIGVMASGYAFGSMLAWEPTRRNRAVWAIGIGGTACFLLLRSFDGYGDPQSWRALAAAGPDGQQGMPAWLAFLNTSKYPASLLFLLMMIGPTISLMPVLEQARGRLSRWLTVFGRVPFLFYMLHIPLIHLLAISVSVVRTGEPDSWLFTNHPMGNPPPPASSVWSLWLLYVVWAAAVFLLYLPCRWFADLKSRRKDWWLSYL